MHIPKFIQQLLQKGPAKYTNGRKVLKAVKKMFFEIYSGETILPTSTHAVQNGDICSFQKPDGRNPKGRLWKYALLKTVLGERVSRNLNDSLNQRLSILAFR
jgi:hypothetical protein